MGKIVSFFIKTVRVPPSHGRSEHQKIQCEENSAALAHPRKCSGNDSLMAVPAPPPRPLSPLPLPSSSPLLCQHHHHINIIFSFFSSNTLISTNLDHVKTGSGFFFHLFFSCRNDVFGSCELRPWQRLPWRLMTSAYGASFC